MKPWYESCHPALVAGLYSASAITPQQVRGDSEGNVRGDREGNARGDRGKP